VATTKEFENVLYVMICINLGRPMRPKNGQWMTFKILVEIKNAHINSKTESFLAKYFGDKSHLPELIKL